MNKTDGYVYVSLSDQETVFKFSKAQLRAAPWVKYSLLDPELGQEFSRENAIMVGGTKEVAEKYLVPYITAAIEPENLQKNEWKQLIAQAHDLGLNKFADQMEQTAANCHEYVFRVVIAYIHMGSFGNNFTDTTTDMLGLMGSDQLTDLLQKCDLNPEDYRIYFQKGQSGIKEEEYKKYPNSIPFIATMKIKDIIGYNAPRGVQFDWEIRAVKVRYQKDQKTINIERSQVLDLLAHRRAYL